MSDEADAETFPSPQSLGPVYGITDAQWTALNKYVVLITMYRSPNAVRRDEPGQPRNPDHIVTACWTWRNDTYQKIVAQAALVSLFCGDTVQRIDQMSASIQALQDSDPLGSAQEIFKIHFDALALSAGDVKAKVDALRAGLEAFIAECRSNDGQEEGFKPGADVLDACAHLGADWSGIAAELEALSQERVKFSTAGAARAAMAQVRAAWVQLGADALTFDTQAHPFDYYTQDMGAALLKNGPNR